MTRYNKGCEFIRENPRRFAAGKFACVGAGLCPACTGRSPVPTQVDVARAPSPAKTRRCTRDPSGLKALGMTPEKKRDEAPRSHGYWLAQAPVPALAAWLRSRI